MLETPWPVAGEERAQTEVVAVQVGGKLRGTLDLPAATLADHEALKQAVLQSALATKYEHCMIHVSPALGALVLACALLELAHFSPACTLSHLPRAS